MLLGIKTQQKALLGGESLLLLHLKDELHLVFLSLFLFFFYFSEENSEEVHVGKICFSPSEVLGHGSAGTFVFRYDMFASRKLYQWIFMILSKRELFFFFLSRILKHIKRSTLFSVPITDSTNSLYVFLMITIVIIILNKDEDDTSSAPKMMSFYTSVYVNKDMV